MRSQALFIVSASQKAAQRGERMRPEPGRAGRLAHFIEAQTASAPALPLWPGCILINLINKYQ
jgi:hypothetical protein